MGCHPAGLPSFACQLVDQLLRLALGDEAGASGFLCCIDKPPGHHMASTVANRLSQRGSRDPFVLGQLVRGQRATLDLEERRQLLSDTTRRRNPDSARVDEREVM